MYAENIRPIAKREGLKRMEREARLSNRMPRARNWNLPARWADFYICFSTQNDICK